MKSQIQLPHQQYLASLAKRYKELTKEELSEYHRLYRGTLNKEEVSEYHRLYASRTKEARAEYSRTYALKTKDNITPRYTKWCKDNKDKIAERYTKWCKDNKDKIAEWRKQYYRTNSEARSNHKIRCWLGTALKREGTKKISWIKNVGCTKEEFKAHIESQFVEGMSWDNWTRDGWHMDHIIPLSKGGTNHYTNLQPLWAKDNLSKRNKLI